MQNRKRDTNVQNRLLDSVGEGEGGVFWKNSIKTCILSRVKQITSPGWMHETSAQGLCTGKPRWMGWRGSWEGGSGWGIHVTTWLIHVSIWENPLQYCQVISLQLIQINEKKKNWSSRRGRRWIGCEEGVKEARTVTQQATFTGNNKGTGSGSSWAQDSCSLNVCWVDLASLGYTIE